MNCPICGKETIPGRLTIGDNEYRGKLNRVYYPRFYPAPDAAVKADLPYISVQMDKDEGVEAHYCPACRKAFAIFEKGYNLSAW